ncbi:MAG: hypothetical protein VB031_02205 [Eubacteriaceae bacterium]|nr:hypothetical protein [Eubacteriaceae bacterium]
MACKKKLLKDMKLTSVDLCGNGCNPKADIKITKSYDGQRMTVREKIMKAVDGILGVDNSPTPEEEMDAVSRAWEESSQSIWNDITMSADEKAEMLAQSANEMSEYIQKSIPEWTGIFKDESEVEESFDSKTPGDSGSKEGEEDMATINVDRMSPEDKETLEKLKKKYAKEEADNEEALEGEGAGEGEEVPPEEDEEESPAVKKALEEVGSIKKTLEMAEMTKVAEKYVPIGKAVDETAEMLYELKNGDQKAYDAVVKAYDDLLDTQEKSGLFKAIGSDHAGGSAGLQAAVAEIRKSKPDISQTDAIELAYRNNPDLPEYNK